MHHKFVCYLLRIPHRMGKVMQCSNATLVLGSSPPATRTVSKFSTMVGSPLYPRALFGSHPQPSVWGWGFPEDYLYHCSIDQRVREKMFTLAWATRCDELMPFLAEIRGTGEMLPFLRLRPVWYRTMSNVELPPVEEDMDCWADGEYHKYLDGTDNEYDGYQNGELWVGHKLLDPYMWPTDSIAFGRHVFLMLAYNYSRDQRSKPRYIAYRRAFSKWVACGGCNSVPYRYFRYHIERGYDLDYSKMPRFSVPLKRKWDDVDSSIDDELFHNSTASTISDLSLWYDSE